MKNAISRLFFCALLLSSLGVKASHIHEEFETFSDPFMIPGHIYLHEGTSTDKPTMFWCHGGPHEATDIATLKNFAEFLDVNVVGFDFRGSIISGYENVAQDLQIDLEHQMVSGFYYGTAGDYGGGHMDDLKAVVSYVKTTYADRLDTEKFIIAGQSFGGYMASLAVTDPQFSATFKLGVLCSGFYDLGAYSLDDCVGDDADSEIQRRRSPLSFTHQMTQPVVLVHGGNNDCTTLVNRKDAEKFEKAARAHNKQIQTLFMENEGHEYSDAAWGEITLTVSQAISEYL